MDESINQLLNKALDCIGSQNENDTEGNNCDDLQDNLRTSDSHSIEDVKIEHVKQPQTDESVEHVKQNIGEDKYLSEEQSEPDAPSCVNKDVKPKRNNKTTLFVLLGVILLVVVVVLGEVCYYSNKPENRYAKAIALFNEGNIKKSISILDKLADEDDYLDAQKRLAYIYLECDSVNLDTKKGVANLKKAALKNDSASFRRLLAFYDGTIFKGKSFVNKSLARYYAKKALNRKICLGVAYAVLADIACGDDDYDLAFYYWKRASEYGEFSADANLGWMYYWGNGCKVDYAKAFNYMYRAFCQDENYDFALYYLGLMYEHGNGVSKNYQKAKSLLKKAADLGNEDAQKEYAEMEMNE